MASKLHELAALVGGEVEGDGNVGIDAVASAASAGAESLVFAENEAAVKAAVASAAGALLVSRKAGDLGGKPAIRAENPRLAFARIATRLNPEPRPAPGVHALAHVHESATVGVGVHVGAFATVGAGAVLGDGAILGPGCHVGDGARVGAGSRLHANVVVYAGVTLGDRVLVHAGAVLGADGFGFVDTPQGRVKFPQLGTLVVGNDVEIGACTTIDRGALDATTIGDGTKIDNQVQIAHNCEIGRCCAISAHTGIAGTSKLGDRVVCGGKVGIADHAEIGDGAVLGAGTGIPTGKVLPGGQVYWGVPVKPVAEAKRLLLAPARIERILGRLAKLEERIAELEG